MNNVIASTSAARHFSADTISNVLHVRKLASALRALARGHRAAGQLRSVAADLDVLPPNDADVLLDALLVDGDVRVVRGRAAWTDHAFNASTGYVLNGIAAAVLRAS